MGDHRFKGKPARLRSSRRVKMLEAERVADLCLDGIVPGSVLDVGTGSGLFAEVFAKRGLRVAGQEYQPRDHTATENRQPSPAPVANRAFEAEEQPGKPGRSDLALPGGHGAQR